STGSRRAVLRSSATSREAARPRSSDVGRFPAEHYGPAGMGIADDTRWLDATDQAALVAAGEVTPVELLDAAIDRIEQGNPAINAVTIEWFDRARATAAAGLPDGSFRGVPFLLKDLW